MLAKAEELGLVIGTGVKVLEITAEGVRCVNGATGEEKLLPADTVLLATGLRPRRAVVEALHGCAEWLTQFKAYLANEFRNGSPGWHIKFEAGGDGMFKEVRVRVNGVLRDVLLDYGKVRSGSKEDIDTYCRPSNYFDPSDDSKEDTHA